MRSGISAAFVPGLRRGLRDLQYGYRSCLQRISPSFSLSTVAATASTLPIFRIPLLIVLRDSASRVAFEPGTACQLAHPPSFVNLLSYTRIYPRDFYLPVILLFPRLFPKWRELELSSVTNAAKTPAISSPCLAISYHSDEQPMSFNTRPYLDVWKERKG